MKPIFGYGPVLRAELETFIKAKRAAAGVSIPWKADFFDRLLPFVAAGKLLRGSVLCFSYETFAGQPPSTSVINAAMALELTHSALLVHDDIMDGDAIRRNRPSLHAQYQSLGANKKLINTEQFGINMAMCGGDAALFLAFELLAGARAGSKAAVTAIQLFTDQLVDTCAGQMQDAYFEARPDMPSRQAIYGLMRTKTAAYTLGLPLAMGAALAGQPAATLKKLRAIGNTAGIIFQIRDDELGALGSPRKTGKPVGSDITSGKKTLLHYYLLKNCGADERRKVNMVFGNPAATAKDISYIQKLISSRKIPKILNDEIDRLEKQALKQIHTLHISDNAKTEFKELVIFCGTRLS